MNNEQHHSFFKGDTAEAQVVSLDHHGAWIDLRGERAFIPLAEIAWFEIEHPSTMMSVGEWIQVTISGTTKNGVMECSLRQLNGTVHHNQDLIVDAVVEVPKGSKNKYAFDKESGQFRLQRVLHSPLHYPFEYGFVPGTLTEGADTLDIMILITEPTFSGCVIECRIIGVLKISDEDEPDDKLLAVPTNDPRFAHMFTLSEVPQHTQKEILHFFQVYKQLEGKQSVINGWQREVAAREILKQGKERFFKQHGSSSI